MGHEEEGEEEEGAGEMCARRHGASASADGCSPGSLHTQRESQTASRNYFFIEGKHEGRASRVLRSLRAFREVPANRDNTPAYVPSFPS